MMKRAIIFAISLLLSCALSAQEGYKRSLKDLPGETYVMLPHPFGAPTLLAQTPVIGSIPLNLTGEFGSNCFKVRLSSGFGSSKACSSAGCKLKVRLGAVTWANPSSQMTIGLQDASSSAGPPLQPDEDWTNEPRVVFNPPGGTKPLSLTATALNEFTLNESGGSRTLTDGGLVCAVFNFTNRAGADQVVVNTITTASTTHLPASATKLDGGSWAYLSAAPNVLITTDDGTLAWPDGGLPAISNIISATYNSTGTDEIGNAIRMPFDCAITGIWSSLSIAAGATSTFHLYDLGGSATGIPTLLKDTAGNPASYPIDDNHWAEPTNARGRIDRVSPPVIAHRGQWVGVVNQAMSANNMGRTGYTFGSTESMLAAGGLQAHEISRDNSGGGAFTATPTNLDIMGVRCGEIRTD